MACCISSRRHFVFFDTRTHLQMFARIYQLFPRPTNDSWRSLDDFLKSYKTCQMSSPLFSGFGKSSANWCWITPGTSVRRNIYKETRRNSFAAVVSASTNLHVSHTNEAAPSGKGAIFHCSIKYGTRKGQHNVTYGPLCLFLPFFPEPILRWMGAIADRAQGNLLRRWSSLRFRNQCWVLSSSHSWEIYQLRGFDANYPDFEGRHFSPCEPNFSTHFTLKNVRARGYSMYTERLVKPLLHEDESKLSKRLCILWSSLGERSFKNVFDASTHS